MSQQPAPRFSTLLKFAHRLADETEHAILPHFRTAIPVDNKAGAGTFDPVTAADRAAEQIIRRLIGETYAQHGIVGEEFGATQPEATFQWVIDPIDGTRSFITGTPMWGTLIGLLRDGEPILGLMNQPYTGERFWADDSASHGRSVSGDTRRLVTRNCASLSEAIVMTTSPDLFAEPVEAERFAHIKREARMTRYGGDCYAYCMLASGLVDLVIEVGLKTYDIAALIPLVERAGGRVTTWDGRPATSGGNVVAAGDPALHASVLKLLNA